MTRTSPTAPTTFHDALRAIQRASGPAALFGHRSDADHDSADHDSARQDSAGQRAATRAYHHLARLVHPDRAPSAHAAEAQAAFAKLGQLWHQHQRQPAEPARTTVRAGGRTYTVGAEIAHGHVADLHRATYRTSDGRDVCVVLKMPRSAEANEAMHQESIALRHLADTHNPSQVTFVPLLIDTFRTDTFRTGAGTDRTANVLAPIPGFHSLSKIAAAYPDGLHALDLVWAWRALLVGLAQAHHAGVVHGAVLPDHVLVRPRDRSLVLVEWGYSVVGRRRPRRRRHPAKQAAVPACALAPRLPVVERFDEFCPAGGPPGAHDELGPSEAGDIHLATRCMTSLFRDDTPLPLLQFAQDCLLPARSRQPKPKAWQLVEEFDNVVDRLYGPRHLRPFHRSTIQLDGRHRR